MKNRIAVTIMIGLCMMCSNPQMSRPDVLGSPHPTLANPALDAPVIAEVSDSQTFLESNSSVRFPSNNWDSKVDALLKQMTLDEKVGQMTQLEIGMVCSGKDQSLQIDPAKLEKAVVKYGVGSVINVKDEALPIEKWHQIIGQIQTAALKTRLKIPVIYGIDTIHGLNYAQGSTLFPQEIGLAATWNPELAKRAAEIAAMETRACGIPWNFSPVLDIGRQPLWPRFYETFGEDPYLAKVMGVATVRGYEGSNIAAKDKVASCLKHYVGYSFPLSGKDRSPAWIPEIYLREYFLPTFQAAIAAGAHTIMVNSGEVNGEPVHVSRYILTDLLRTELGFRGMVVSDWEDIKKLVSQHAVAATEKEATRMAVMAGIDMSMVPSDYSFSDHLITLVKEGAVPQARIDEAVRRVLHLKYELGLFESPMPDASVKSNLGRPESRAVSLQAAQESITLLKNSNNLLPLAKGRKVFVTGPTADSQISLNNGWTYTWQGTKADLYPKDRPTILRAIEEKVGKQNVTFVPGASLDKEINLAEAAAAARNSDVAILCLGEGGYAETPGNIDDLTLSESQLTLAEAIIATGKPTVLVLVEGRPRVIARIAERVGALVMAYNPSLEGGQSIANVLFGDYNPNGKLPFTYPRYANAQLSYDHKIWESGDTPFGYTALKPQFDFGAGLSYTTFEYTKLNLDRPTMNQNGELTVSVTVTNSGKRAGKEVVQLYVRDVVASITPSGKRLRRFAKIHLEPGQARTLSFRLRSADLSFIGRNNKPVVEPGDFEVIIGGLKDKFTLQ